jgi:hypothetical protein
LICGNLVYFSPVLVNCIKKNLATLVSRSQRSLVIQFKTSHSNIFWNVSGLQCKLRRSPFQIVIYVASETGDKHRIANGFLKKTLAELCNWSSRSQRNFFDWQPTLKIESQCPTKLLFSVFYMTYLSNRMLKRNDVSY